jgi:hypothetical protein
MSEAQPVEGPFQGQLQEDLRFVREAVARREAAVRRPVAIYWVWAVYVLVGYSMIDLAPRYCGWFFMIGGVVGGILSAVLGRRAQRRTGEQDREMGRRAMLHWLVGILLAVAGTFGLAAVIPALRGSAGSQVLVVMIGIVYFLAGVHFDRNFLWLGPVLIAGGILVGLIPRYGWTGLGVVIALGLIVPTLFDSRPAQVVAPTAR